MILASNLAPGAGPLIVARAPSVEVYRGHTSVGRLAGGRVRSVRRTRVGERIHALGAVIAQNARALVGGGASGDDVIEQRQGETGELGATIAEGPGNVPLPFRAPAALPD